MRLSTFDIGSSSVASAAKELAAALEPHLNTPVTVADAVALTGLPIETARTALTYLVVRNNPRVTFVGDDDAYIFSEVNASIAGVVPTPVRVLGRYAVDLLASQFTYLLAALVAIGPAFIGITMFMQGLPIRDPFLVLGGGTLALASVGFVLQLALRSLTVVLPPLVLGGIAIGWERWTTNDLFWIPLVVLVAVAMQADALGAFRNNRPDHSLRLLFWGRGFTSGMTERKRLVDLIAAMGGTVTTADLMRAFGWTAAKAGEALSDVLIEYGGDVALDRDGTLYLRFDEISGTKLKPAVPAPAYLREREAPGPFEGLDVGWIFVVAVACFIGLAASPLNSVYTEFVAGVDVTLQGVGLVARRVLAGLFTFPLFVYVGRLLFNVFDRTEFGERRQFLDAMEYADKHAEGSLIAIDKYDDKTLAALNAEIDEEQSVPHAIWVSFPDFIGDRAKPSAEVVFGIFDAEPDASEASMSQEVTAEQAVSAAVRRR